MIKIKEKICIIFRKIGNFLINNDTELLFLGGFICISIASFLINRVVGFYILGVILIFIAYFLLKHPEGDD